MDWVSTRFSGSRRRSQSRRTWSRRLGRGRLHRETTPSLDTKRQFSLVCLRRAKGWFPLVQLLRLSAQGWFPFVDLLQSTSERWLPFVGRLLLATEGWFSLVQQFRLTAEGWPPFVGLLLRGRFNRRQNFSLPQDCRHVSFSGIVFLLRIVHHGVEGDWFALYSLHSRCHGSRFFRLLQSRGGPIQGSTKQVPFPRRLGTFRQFLWGGVVPFLLSNLRMGFCKGVIRG